MCQVRLHGTFYQEISFWHNFDFNEWEYKVTECIINLNLTNMKNRKAVANWEGNLKNGVGTLKLDSLNQELSYNFTSRFEEGNQTNPEELIAAAHAGCFSMALSAMLTEEGYEPESIKTVATVSLDKTDSGFKISKSALVTEARIPGIDENMFQKLAEQAKENCPVSQALGGVEISLETHFNK